MNKRIPVPDEVPYNKRDFKTHPIKYQEVADQIIDIMRKTQNPLDMVQESVMSGALSYWIPKLLDSKPHETCQWAYEGEIPIPSCEPDMIIPAWLAQRRHIIDHCPYCGGKILGNIHHG